MHQGRGGMGTRKHGKSGLRNRPKSPRLRHWLKHYAETDQRKRRPRGPMYGSVREAIDEETK